ncbi:MAG: tetratricopeptide repeat protein [Candidatus Omnitrophica bacterium]|nr:tetratricopeptide repeat protein [Candidatus Omnitrophota bacterium]
MAKQIKYLKSVSIIILMLFLSGCSAIFPGYMGGRDWKNYKCYTEQVSAINDLKDKDWFVRLTATGSLGVLGGEEAIEPLSNLTSDPNFYVRKEAVKSLDKTFLRTRSQKALAGVTNYLGDVALPIGENETVDSVAEGSLLRYAKDAVSSLISAALNGKNPKIKTRAMEILIKISDSRSVEPFISLLQDKDSNIRMLAINALGTLEDKRATEPLLALTKDKKWGGLAIGALARIKDEKSVEPLILLLKEKKPDFRDSAARALGRIKDKRAVEPLVALLNDKTLGVSVIVALGELKDTRAVEPLVPLLNRKNKVMTVWWVAWALGEIKDPRAAKPLVDVLVDERVEKTEILSYGNPDKVWIATQSIPRQVDEALVKIGEPAVSCLEEVTKGRNARIRLRASRILEKIRGTSPQSDKRPQATREPYFEDIAEGKECEKRGIDYVVEGKFEEAKKEFEKALDYGYTQSLSSYELDTLNKTIHPLLTKEDIIAVTASTQQSFRIMEKNLNEEIARYSKLITENPGSFRNYLSRANVYFHNDQYEQAISDYGKVIQLNSGSTEIYLKRGDAYFRDGQYDRAIADYSEAIKLYPDFAESRLKRGDAYFRQGRYEQAINNYTEAIQLNRTLTNAYLNRGNAYFKLSQYEQAISDYESAATWAPPGLFMPYFNRALVYAKIGSLEQARQSYEIFLGEASASTANFYLQQARQRITELKGNDE